MCFRLRRAIFVHVCATVLSFAFSVSLALGYGGPFTFTHVHDRGVPLAGRDAREARGRHQLGQVADAHVGARLADLGVALQERPRITARKLARSVGVLLLLTLLAVGCEGIVVVTSCGGRGDSEGATVEQG